MTRLLENLSDFSHDPRARIGVQLDLREIELRTLWLVALSNKAIAQSLSISPNTVEVPHEKHPPKTRCAESRRSGGSPRCAPACWKINHTSVSVGQVALNSLMPASISVIGGILSPSS
ncbi:MAG: LuxR C-terminal-related transcriptional regulator [Anaerolineae bacterium]